MLRKISLALVVLVSIQSAAETDCSMYFIEKHIFAPQSYKIQNTFEVLSPLEDTPNGIFVFNDTILERTPIQAYALEVEAQALLKNLSRQGLKALETYKHLSDTVSFTSNSDTHKSFQVRLESLITELIETSKLATNRDDIQIYFEKSQDQFRLLEELMTQVRELAFKLDVMTPQVRNMSSQISNGFNHFRLGNIRMLLTYQRLRPYFQAHVDNAQRLLNGTSLAESQIDARYLEPSQSRTASLPNLRIIQDTPTIKDPRQKRYSQSWESRYGTPHKETVPHPKHPDTQRARISRDVYVPTYTSGAKADKITPLETYEVTIKVSPSKLVGVHPFKDLMDDIRQWATRNKLIDKIQFSHNGSPQGRLRVTITNKGSRETFETFMREFSGQLGTHILIQN